MQLRMSLRRNLHQVSTPFEDGEKNGENDYRTAKHEQKLKIALLLHTAGVSIHSSAIFASVI